MKSQKSLTFDGNGLKIKPSDLYKELSMFPHLSEVPLQYKIGNLDEIAFLTKTASGW